MPLPSTWLHQSNFAAFGFFSLQPALHSEHNSRSLCIWSLFRISCTGLPHSERHHFVRPSILDCPFLLRVFDVTIINKKQNKINNHPLACPTLSNATRLTKAAIFSSPAAACSASHCRQLKRMDTTGGCFDRYLSWAFLSASLLIINHHKNIQLIRRARRSRPAGLQSS